MSCCCRTLHDQTGLEEGLVYTLSCLHPLMSTRIHVCLLSRLHVLWPTCDTLQESVPSLTSPSGRPEGDSRGASSSHPSSPSTGLIQAWIDSARGTLSRTMPLAIFSGFSLPSPTQLLRRTGSAFDPSAAAALRHAIEGSVLQSGSLDAAFESAGASPKASTQMGVVHTGDGHMREATSDASCGGTRAGAAASYDLRRTSARLRVSGAAASAAGVGAHPPQRPCGERAETADLDGGKGAGSCQRIPAQPVHRCSAAEESQEARLVADGVEGGDGGGPRFRGVCREEAAGIAREGRKTPLVFMHGVGFGVFPYLGFVWKLLAAFPGALATAVSCSVCGARPPRGHKCASALATHEHSMQLTLSRNSLILWATRPRKPTIGREFYLQAVECRSRLHFS
jgi:hypothetical protein